MNEILSLIPEHKNLKKIHCLKLENKLKVKEINEKIKVLKLNDEESIIKPNLQVSTNNIMASHNTTCKMIDKNSLFYLMSKGLSKTKAIKLIKEGFLNNLE